MLRLESVETCASIAETGSITRAARRLAISKSVVSERLAELERRLGAKLVHRTTRTLLLTEDGGAFYERGKLILRDVDNDPAIEMTLELDDRFVDMLAEGYDAVVRHGPVDDKRVIVKRLAASRRSLVASPDYLKRFGKPISLPDLEKHRGILYPRESAKGARAGDPAYWDSA